MSARIRPFANRHISSRFGWRLTPGALRKSFHKGDDYNVPGGSIVRASEAGEVAQRRTDRRSGNTLTIVHAGGYKTKYHHLRYPANVKPGDTVSAGEPIGVVGHTGTAAHGDHLHFEVWLNGRNIDPETYFATQPLIQGESA